MKKESLGEILRYAAYALAASYIGLLVMLIGGLGVRFVVDSILVEYGVCFALSLIAAGGFFFWKFRAIGYHDMPNKEVNLSRLAIFGIIANIIYVAVNFAVEFKNPGALNAVEFSNILVILTQHPADPRLATAEIWKIGKIFFLLGEMIITAVNVIGMVVGYSFGKKKRLADRKELVGEEKQD